MTHKGWRVVKPQHNQMLPILHAIGNKFLRGMDTLNRFFFFFFFARFYFFQGRQLLWLPVCFPAHPLPYEKKESTLKGKNLLPLGANSFFLEQTPFRKETKINGDQVASPEKVSILFNCPGTVRVTEVFFLYLFICWFLYFYRWVIYCFISPDRLVFID